VTDTLVSLWTDVRKRLEAAGVDTPVFDSRLLVEAGAGVSRLDILTDPRRPMSQMQAAAVAELARRREAREPLAYVLGRKHFWTLDLAVDQNVLVPRPETELIVETALAAIAPDAPARVLDLGVGSGAILLSILVERPNAIGVGVDISEPALAVARANARSLQLEDRVEFRVGDWWQGLDQSFDVVVSNPPYIASGDLAGLAPEVALFEPRIALDGGVDGLAAYRAIIGGLGVHLRPGGIFALEVGSGQAEAVRTLAVAAGLLTGSPLRDLSGAARAVVGRVEAG
jgi:release factor glutamine methyltransferase